MNNLNELTDEQLAVCYAEGNNRAFDLLLSRSEVKLFSYIMFMVHDESLANDIFQETFVKVITQLQKHEYMPNGKFCSWCMRIAHNIVMDMFRDNNQRRIVDTVTYDPTSKALNEYVVFDNVESGYVKEQVYADVKRIMNLLPPTQREVVFMRFYQQLSFKEIAETTNVSINTSLGRMRYALMNMRRIARENDICLNVAMF